MPTLVWEKYRLENANWRGQLWFAYTEYFPKYELNGVNFGW